MIIICDSANFGTALRQIICRESAELRRKRLLRRCNENRPFGLVDGEKPPHTVLPDTKRNKTPEMSILQLANRSDSLPVFAKNSSPRAFRPPSLLFLFFSFFFCFSCEGLLFHGLAIMRFLSDFFGARARQLQREARQERAEKE